MKKVSTVSVLACLIASVHAQSFTDSAQVRSVEPVMENVTVPREECSNHWIQEPMRRSVGDRSERQDRNYGGAIVGGLAGGVIGHQFGSGSGKDAATALGVILGAMVGDQHQNRLREDRPDDREVEVAHRQVRRCQTVYDSQSRVTGYRVVYEYRGQQYSTLTRNHPGQQLRLRVSVNPIEQ